MSMNSVDVNIKYFFMLQNLSYRISVILNYFEYTISKTKKSFQNICINSFIIYKSVFYLRLHSIYKLLILFKYFGSDFEISYLMRTTITKFQINEMYIMKENSQNIN